MASAGGKYIMLKKLKFYPVRMKLAAVLQIALLLLHWLLFEVHESKVTHLTLLWFALIYVGAFFLFRKHVRNTMRIILFTLLLSTIAGLVLMVYYTGDYSIPWVFQLIWYFSVRSLPFAATVVTFIILPNKQEDSND